MQCQGLALALGTGEIVALTPHDGGQIQVRDGQTLALERSFPVNLPVPPDGYCGSYVMGVSADGRTAAYAAQNPGKDESIRFVDLRTGHVRMGQGPLAGGDLVAVSQTGGLRSA